MFLTFVSTSVHVLLEVHYVTIQIRPVLYMLLNNLGFIRKGYVLLTIDLSNITLHMILYVNYLLHILQTIPIVSLLKSIKVYVDKLLKIFTQV